MARVFISAMILTICMGVNPLVAAEKPLTGRKAADGYFKKRKKNRYSKSRARVPSSSGMPRYMALQLGSFVSEDTYKWGENEENDVGT